MMPDRAAKKSRMILCCIAYTLGVSQSVKQTNGIHKKAQDHCNYTTSVLKMTESIADRVVVKMLEAKW
jgi:hypothetical protein